MRAIAVTNQRKFTVLNVGDKLQGRYEIKEIRMGGFRVVYIAHDYLSEKLVMVETLRDEYLDHKDLIERFLEQSRIVMKLRECPHIVRAERIETISGKPYIFYEYVDGRTLEEEIRNQSLDPIRSLDIAIQFCDGMDCVHNVNLGDGRKGVVHGDIKPSHIWITRHGVVKITGFDIAKPLESPSLYGAGTPAYMAPEQFLEPLLNLKGYPVFPLGIEADVYAFGLVLYEMITGKRVVEIESDLEKEIPREASQIASRFYINSGYVYCFLKTLKVSPPPPSRNEHLNAVILKCLEKRPSDRYKSFEALREELIGIYGSLSGQNP